MKTAPSAPRLISSCTARNEQSENLGTSSDDVQKTILRNKLLGRWAAEKLGITGPDADAYSDALAAMGTTRDPERSDVFCGSARDAPPHLEPAPGGSGMGYRAVANEIRFEIARQLLQDTEVSLGQIAAALCYSEASAFTRAFRGWSGLTPSAWRAGGRPA